MHGIYQHKKLSSYDTGRRLTADDYQVKIQLDDWQTEYSMLSLKHGPQTLHLLSRCFFYHFILRGNGGQDIFSSKNDRTKFYLGLS
jgi:hypothetical protein